MFYIKRYLRNAKTNFPYGMQDKQRLRNYSNAIHASDSHVVVEITSNVDKPRIN